MTPTTIPHQCVQASSLSSFSVFKPLFASAACIFCVCCKVFLPHPLKRLLFHSPPFLKRECFVEAAPGYSGIHSSALKPRLRGRVLCLWLVPLPSSERCACVVSWHSLWGGCCGFCSVFCSRNYVNYQVHYSLFKTFSSIAGY